MLKMLCIGVSRLVLVGVGKNEQQAGPGRHLSIVLQIKGEVEKTN
jgi:hypothetical protein